ncbi:MAG: hypothetical protein AABY22_12435 [Nanoarchaeota archaeon]
MKKLILSDEQLKKLLNLIDLNLKLNGLAVLQDTVDLYNVLMTAENYQILTQPEQYMETQAETNENQ